VRAVVVVVVGKTQRSLRVVVWSVGGWYCGLGRLADVLAELFGAVAGREVVLFVLLGRGLRVASQQQRRPTQGGSFAWLLESEG
jgi:hypothetical protein